MKALSRSAVMLLLHSVCLLPGPKTICCKLYHGSSGWYAACKRDVIGYRFMGHSAKIACLLPSNANSDSFETGREEPRVTGVFLAEDIFSLLSDLPPLSSPEIGKAESPYRVAFSYDDLHSRLMCLRSSLSFSFGILKPHYRKRHKENL